MKVEKITVNSAMILQKTVKERVAELRALRSQTATEKTTTYWHESASRQPVEEIKVKYDIRLLDKKITTLENFLFRLDSAIKQSNAKTEIEVEYDLEALLAPLD